MEKHNVAMLSEAVELFNCGAASESYGTVSSGNSFEKICLWLKPLNGQRFRRCFIEWWCCHRCRCPFWKVLLPLTWKTTAELPVNKLNLPGISNLESGNAFYVVGESDNSFSLVVFQITVGKSRPVKVNGLCDILKAFPANVVSNIKHKVLVFVFQYMAPSTESRSWSLRRDKMLVFCSILGTSNNTFTVAKFRWWYLLAATAMLSLAFISGRRY